MKVLQTRTAVNTAKTPVKRSNPKVSRRSRRDSFSTDSQTPKEYQSRIQSILASSAFASASSRATSSELGLGPVLKAINRSIFCRYRGEIFFKFSSASFLESPNPSVSSFNLIPTSKRSESRLGACSHSRYLNGECPLPVNTDQSLLF